MILSFHWNEMKFFFTIQFVFLLIFLFGCETVQKKSDDILQKENERLSKFIGQPISELKIVLGNPDNEETDEKGSKLLIYKTKKYGIKCERSFEINEVDMVVVLRVKDVFKFFLYLLYFLPKLVNNKSFNYVINLIGFRKDL